MRFAFDSTILVNGESKMKINVLLSATIAALTLSACALTTDRIDLQYSPQSNVGVIPGARNIVVVVRVTDQRQDKSKIGSKKNGYGMELAPILPAEDVALTIQTAMTRELRASGFQLGSNGMVEVSAEITRFANDFKMGLFAGDAVADLIMGVSVRSPRRNQIYSRQILSQGVEPNIQIATGDNAKLALDRALQNAMQLLFEDQSFISALLQA